MRLFTLQTQNMLIFIGNQFKKPRGFSGRLVSSFMKKYNRSIHNKIIPWLEIKQDDRLLEIGYGPGKGLDMICNTYNCTVTGIDFSELMFNEARLRNKKHIDNNKLALNLGNYLDFKISAESFDKIFCINVIYFWDNLEKPFKKILQELKQGGTLSMFMGAPDDLRKFKFTKDGIFNKYTIDYVSDELKRSGFKNMQYIDDHGYYIKCSK